MDPLERLKNLGVWDWWDDARDDVMAGLADADDRRRALAVELASEVIDDEVAQRLMKIIVEDPVDAIRGAAAIALGPALEDCDTCDWDDDFDSPFLSRACFDDVRRLLERAYRDADVPEEVRRRALEAAVRAPEPWQRDAVRAAWRVTDEKWRMTAVFGMGYLGGFDDEILEAFEIPGLLAEAVFAAGIAGVEAAGPRVLELARGCPDHDLRLAAVSALGAIEIDGAYELLMDLSLSEDGALSEVASEALAIRGDSQFADDDLFD